LSTGVDGGRRLVLALAGSPLPPEPTLDVPSLQARLVEVPDDDDAREALLRLIHARTLPGRLAAAIAEDTVDVILNDGSLLSRAAAERALAQKEEERVYAPLRGPLLKARRRVLDPLALRQAFDDATRAVGLGPSPLLAEDTRFLREFLTASAPLSTAALEVLEASAGPIVDAATLARALDRPAGEHGGEHGSDATAVEVVRVTRAALPADVRPLQRRAAPRILAGHVVDDGEVVRVLWAEGRRLGGQRALLGGVGRSYGRLAGITEVGTGLGLALQNLPVRRAAGASSSTAAALWRETVAASLLQARIGAAVAVADVAAEVDPEAPAAEQRAMRRDAVWRAARSAVGVPVGELADDLLLPPWPDGILDFDAATAMAWRCRKEALAAHSALFLRDVGDEGLLLRPRALEAVREALTDPRSPPQGEAVAAAWRTLLGEVA
jgi:hypothetical protein